LVFSKINKDKINIYIYLYIYSFENINKLSFIKRGQVSEVQVIQVDDFSNKDVANQMHKFIQKIIK
jgi:hypothetical protein